MSRTDKTAPYFVKMMWVPVEHHDHTIGPCTLPEHPPRKEADFPTWRDRYRSCYWDTDWNHPIYRCGCNWCSYDFRSANRKRRHDYKAALKAGRYEDIPFRDHPNGHYC